MDLKQKIVMLLGIAASPRSAEDIADFVSPDDRTAVNSALLELMLSGDVQMESNKFLLAKAQAADTILPEPEPEPESVAATSQTSEESDLPPWPWPEYAIEPKQESDSPSYPFSEGSGTKSMILADEDEAFIGIKPADECNDGILADGAQAHTLYRDDPLSCLSLTPSQYNRLTRLGVATISDVVSDLDTFRRGAVPVRLCANLVDQLSARSGNLRGGLTELQQNELSHVSGNSDFGFDMFGALVKLPHADSHIVPYVLATKHGAFDGAQRNAFPELEDVIQDDVLMRRLLAGGIRTIDDLLSKTDDELLAIRGFGLKKLEMIKEKIAPIKALRASVTPGVTESLSDFQTHENPCYEEESDAARELLMQAQGAIDPEGLVLWRNAFEIEILPLAEQALQSSEDGHLRVLIDAFWAIDGIVDSFEKRVARLFGDRQNAPSVENAGILVPADGGWESVVHLLTEGRVCDFDNKTGMLTKHLLSLDEWLNTLDERHAGLLRARFDGATLEEAGVEFGLTKERVRQIQKRELSRRPALREDSYGYLVDKYAMSRDEFCYVTGQAPNAYEYLDIVSPGRKADRLPLASARYDELVPIEVREALQSTKVTGFLLVDGEHVPARKYDLTKAVLARHGEEGAISVETLITEYRALLKENNEEEQGALSLTSSHAYEAWLMRQDGILYAPTPKSFDPEGRSVRLYDHAHMDFGCLVDYLESGIFTNIECSTALIFNHDSFASIKEALDIRNEYELHVVIRRFCGEMEGVTLGRCPMLQFGEASRREQLLMLIEEQGPISAKELANAYEKTYGVDAFTVELNYLKFVSDYLVDDNYEVSGNALSEEQFEYLGTLLTRDVQLLAHVRERFAVRFGSDDGIDVNSVTLSKLGFDLRGIFVVRRGFDLEGYFSELLDSNACLEIKDNDYLAELMSDAAFRGALNARLRRFALIETAPNRYESLTELQREFPTFSQTFFADYVDSLCAFLEQDAIETIQSVRAKGFDHPLHAITDSSRLGNGFLEAVVGSGYASHILKRTRANGTLVFSRRNGSLTMPNVIEMISNRCGTLDPEPIREMLLADYGIDLLPSIIRMITGKLEGTVSPSAETPDGLSAVEVPKRKSIGLSKSRFTKGVQCPKMLWMEIHMREKYDEAVMNQAVLETGSRVGDAAMGYYGEYVEVPFDPRDYAGMIALTQELLDAGTATICEATFSFDGNLCMVDILRVEPDGVHIVEVKSATSIHEIYYFDMAYQLWVLQRCGMNVKSVSLMHVNNEYVRHGALDLQRLFVVEDCTDLVESMQANVEASVRELRDLAAREDEPEFDIGAQCKKPYECGYRGWCWRDVPQPSVFDLNRIRFDRAFSYFENGVVSLGDVLASGVPLSRRQIVQVAAESQARDEIVDTAAVRSFLDGLRFPLYFLDFETMQLAIPQFNGTRPYQQIPTQYSLHVLHEPNGLLEHYEFLAEEGTDPRRAVAEHLVADIPAGACTLAYNMGFEKGRIAELAELFPDLSEHLLAINEGMRDLIVPFRSGDYYVRAMGGSNSIKAVLPALFPGDPALDYHELEGIHNGSEAMDAYARLVNMEPEEAGRTREQLLRYCELDTLAMVRIWEKLVDVSKWHYDVR